MDIFYLRKNVSNIIRIILISLIFLIFIICLVQNSTPVYAKDSDDNDESLTHSKFFQNFGTEVSNIKGEIIDSDSIEIDLLSSEWNITEIFMEFYDISIKEKDEIVKTKIKEPKDINFSLLIDKKVYKVEDIKFKLKKNFAPKVRIFQIPYNTNLSLLTDEKLNLMINYTFNLTKFLDLEGNVYIKEDSANLWSFNLQIIRYTNYHIIDLNFPKNWDNLRVYRNGKQITSEISIIENLVSLSNETILNNSIWLITANSPNLEFSVDLSDDDIEPDQKLKVSIEPPIQNGQLTAVLLNPSGEEESSKTKDVISEETTFSYTFDAEYSEGDWKIVVFWSNDANAGVETDKIQFIAHPAYDQQLLQLTILTAIIIGAVSFISYFSALKIRNISEERKLKILDRCNDLLNLDYIIVIEKVNGIKVYDQTFPGKPFNVMSFTEFLNYVQRLGIEIIEEKKEIWTIKIDFKNYKLFVTDYKQFKTIFVMKEIPSKDFFDSIKDLTISIQNQYSKYLKIFIGQTKPFESIKELLEHHLQIYFLYPLRLNKLDTTKLNRDEESLIILAQDLMKQYNLSHFYIKYLFPDNNYESNDIKRIIGLIDKDVFHPLYLD